VQSGNVSRQPVGGAVQGLVTYKLTPFFAPARTIQGQRVVHPDMLCFFWTACSISPLLRVCCLTIPTMPSKPMLMNVLGQCLLCGPPEANFLSLKCHTQRLIFQGKEKLECGIQAQRRSPFDPFHEGMELRIART